MVAANPFLRRIRRRGSASPTDGFRKPSRRALMHDCKAGMAGIAACSGTRKGLALPAGATGLGYCAETDCCLSIVKKRMRGPPLGGKRAAPFRSQPYTPLPAVPLMERCILGRYNAAENHEKARLSRKIGRQARSGENRIRRGNGLPAWPFLAEPAPDDRLKPGKKSDRYSALSPDNPIKGTLRKRLTPEVQKNGGHRRIRFHPAAMLQRGVFDRFFKRKRLAKGKSHRRNRPYSA